MLIKGMVIKHEKAMDVCYEITYVSYADNEYHVGLVPINMGFVDSWYIDQTPFSAKINKDQLSGWSKLENPGMNCYRYGNWIPILS